MPIAKENVMDKLLTIAIPTFNRAAKLKRLLTVLQDEINTSCLHEQIDILISDNASIDDTASIASEFTDSNFSLEYYRQSENLGFDGNLRYLYSHARTRFVWFMADDDLPLKGAIGKILSSLEMHDPDVLLFSFIQPPGSTVRQFNYSTQIWFVNDPVSAIEHVLRYPKLSIYVLRKINFDESQWNVLDVTLGSGWYFISLAFSVLETSPKPLLVTISEPLATCDEDHVGLPWVPFMFLRMDKMVQHPFVLKHNQSLSKIYKNKGYCQAIQFSFAAKCGSLIPERMEDYDHFIHALKWRIPTLIRNPRTLMQLMALKLHIANLWSRIRPILRWVRKPLKKS